AAFFFRIPGRALEGPAEAARGHVAARGLVAAAPGRLAALPAAAAGAASSGPAAPGPATAGPAAARPSAPRSAAGAAASRTPPAGVAPTPAAALAATSAALRLRHLLDEVEEVAPLLRAARQLLSLRRYDDAHALH